MLNFLIIYQRIVEHILLFAYKLNKQKNINLVCLFVLTFTLHKLKPLRHQVIPPHFF